MLDVRRLRLLCDLARLGTIAAVAAAHTFTPSAVSQQLSALEREAGVRLLTRTGRSVTLTAADAATDTIETMSDARGSAAYKKQLVRVYVERALRAAINTSAGHLP